MNYHDSKMLNALAQRFVLGTMSRRARRRFGRLVDEDQQIAAGVYSLEEKLLPMAWSLQPVAPSDLVWRRITRQAGIGVGTPRQPSAPKTTMRWPLLAASLSVALIASMFGWWQERQQPADVIIETITEHVPLEPTIGIIEDEAGSPLWVARIYGDVQRVDVSVRTEPEQKTSNDYQLWVLRDDGVPVSLGLLPQTGERSLTLAANAVAALERGTALAVSLEPVGGSLSALPSGPVLYSAALLAP